MTDKDVLDPVMSRINDTQILGHGVDTAVMIDISRDQQIRTGF